MAASGDGGRTRLLCELEKRWDRGGAPSQVDADGVTMRERLILPKQENIWGKITSACQAFIRLWLPPVLWMVLIFWLSAQSQLPGLSVTWLDWLLKHAGHFGGYGVLAWLWWRITVQFFRDRYRAAALAFTGAFLYAVTDEIHQSFVPGRDASWLDLAIDALGAASAMGVVLWRRLDKRQVGTTCSTTMVDPR